MPDDYVTAQRVASVAGNLRGAASLTERLIHDLTRDVHVLRSAVDRLVLAGETLCGTSNDADAVNAWTVAVALSENPAVRRAGTGLEVDR